MHGSVTDAVEVSVPARAEYVRLLRTVAAAAGARHDLTVDAIEDLRIAVDEAGAQLLHLGGATLILRIGAADDGVLVEVTTDATDAAWPPDGMERSLAWQVLEGLTDEVAVDRGADGPSIRIRKRAVGATSPP
ncbi:MAG: ATP-binding protein [Candidatus Velamenicoccus archaeovorus]